MLKYESVRSEIKGGSLLPQWRLVADSQVTNVFECVIPDAKFAGVRAESPLAVQLEVGGTIARVSYKYKWSMVDGEVSQQQQRVRAEIEGAVAQPVNALLAVALASQIREQVREYVRPKLTSQAMAAVDMVVSQDYRIRATTFVG